MTSLFSFTSQVFYIFYENEETSDKGVKSGLDLQRYIHEEVDNCVFAMEFSPGGRKLCFSAILYPQSLRHSTSNKSSNVLSRIEW